jgi:hypothetical protein
MSREGCRGPAAVAATSGSPSETGTKKATLETRSDLCIPRNETALGLVPNFHIHGSVSGLYIPTDT